MASSTRASPDFVGILWPDVPRITSPVFVGRGAELAALDDALAAATAGSLSAVLVGGDAGVGKTRLVSTWAARSRASGATVGVGNCLDLGEAGPPFVSIVEALRSMLDGMEPTERIEVLGDARAELGRLLPELDQARGGDLASNLSRSSQGGLFESLATVLRRAAQRGPLAIVIEDLHLADESTRLCLTYLIGAKRTPGVLLVATYRSDDLHRRHPLRPFLSNHAKATNVDVIELRPFTRVELAAFVTAILPSKPSVQVVDSFFARADGNAFQTEELLAAGRGDATVAVPDSVRDAMLLRLNSLGSSAQRVVAVAAVAGMNVDPELISATADLPDAAVVDGIHEALAANVLVAAPRGQRLRFRHALLREIVHDELLPTERKRIHRALATTIDRNRSLADGGFDTAAAILAHHWTMAGQPDSALLASLEAAESAGSMTAYREARQQYERAADLWEAATLGRSQTELELVDVIERASESARLGGEFQRAIQHAEAALRLLDEQRDPTRTADLLVRLSWMFSETADNARGMELAVEAVRVAALAPPNATRVRALGALSSFVGSEGDPLRARTLLEEAISVGDALGETWPRMELVTIDLEEGRVAQAIETARFVQQHAAASGDRETGAAVLGVLAYGLVDVGLLAQGLEEAWSAVEVAESAGLDRADGAWARFAAGEAQFRLGRPREAAATVAAALASAPEGKVSAALHTLAALIDEQRGDLTSANEHLLAAQIERITAEEERRRAYLARARIRVALADGRTRDALEIGAASAAALLAIPALAVTNRRSLLPLAAVSLSAAAEVVESSRLRRDEPGLERAYAAAGLVWRGIERLERARLEAGLAEPTGLKPWRLWCSAEQHRVDASSSAEAWDEVASAFDQQAEPFPAAEARYHQAEALLVRRAPQRAVSEVINIAMDAAIAVEAVPLIERLNLLARRARIRVEPGASEQARRSKALAPDDVMRRYGLTRRERQVLGLLADGWTNRQIADYLYVTESTAGVHVANVVHKMELPNRVAAGIAARKMGLAAESLSDDAR